MGAMLCVCVRLRVREREMEEDGSAVTCHSSSVNVCVFPHSLGQHRTWEGLVGGGR